MIDDADARLFLEAQNPYPEYAVAAFRAVSGPRLASLVSTETAVLRQPTVDYCSPAASASGYRLFPGSLYLLLRRVVGHGPENGEEETATAAAIELAHNATLIHDDNLDDHSFRRGLPTLLARHGRGPSLLFGNAALLLAVDCLFAAGRTAAGKVRELCSAVEKCCLGQLLDEPACWRELEPEQWHQRWFEISELKLEVGNLGAALFDEEIGTPASRVLSEVLRRFAPVSQVINDFNDLDASFGYQVVEKGGRSRHEETSRKPTLPVILAAEEAGFRYGPCWQAYGDLLKGDLEGRVRARAMGLIEGRREEALSRLDGLGLVDSAWRHILTSFFVSPAMSSSTANREG